MKFILLAVTLSFVACNKPSAPVPKIAEPQREALEKAKGVDQVMQQENEAAQKKLNETDGK